MRSLIILGLAWAAFSSPAGAQSLSMDEVLRQVEANNKELKANYQSLKAQKVEAKLDNNLPDPSVTYSHFWGNKEDMGFTGEFVASQSFDFPTLYYQRGKLAKERAAGLDRQGASFRQQVLLQAQTICLDLVLLNQQRALLATRLDNAERLSAFYASKLEKGDANVIETNKIDLELLNTRTEYDLNENAREQKLRELALLNGGVEVAFDDTTYAIADELPDFESIRQEAIEADPNLQALRNDRVTALRQIRVNKAKGLPGLELGYRMNPSTGGRRYNGFLVGISIPLFSNRNYVRQAKAQALYAENRLESANDTAENELARLYSQALTLRESLDKYQSVLDKQNNVEILERAIQAGQISMIEYFVNVTTYYQSLQNYFTLQNQYQKVMAQLYKYRL